MPLRPPAGFISAFYDPLNNPNAPTIGTATGGDASASVAFTAPANVGGSAISLYGARSTPDNITATAASSPISVTGLTNGTAYTFAVWAINSYGPSAFSAASNSATPAAPTGLFSGGFNDSGSVRYNTIDYINISSAGDAIDFGDLTQVTSSHGSCSSNIRGVFGGGSTTGGTLTDVISYVTIATTGNATSFGSLTAAQTLLASCSNSTRGLFGGGNLSGGATNVIEYIAIATTGNATDFGDLTVARRELASCASTTRGVFGGGDTGSRTNVIDYVTIATTGNATDFGDLTSTTKSLAGCSSPTRGLFAGGYSAPDGDRTNVISYITIASAGNATDFGDLTAYYALLAGCSSSTVGVFGGGRGGASAGGSGTLTNVISYVTIASTGNASSFGALTQARESLAACSNVHGGL